MFCFLSHGGGVGWGGGSGDGMEWRSRAIGSVKKKEKLSQFTISYVPYPKQSSRGQCFVYPVNRVLQSEYHLVFWFSDVRTLYLPEI